METSHFAIIPCENRQNVCFNQSFQIILALDNLLVLCTVKNVTS